MRVDVAVALEGRRAPRRDLRVVAAVARRVEDDDLGRLALNVEHVVEAGVPLDAACKHGRGGAVSFSRPFSGVLGTTYSASTIRW